MKNDYPTAPFVITFHDEASLWKDSPVLQALKGCAVIVGTYIGSYIGMVLDIDDHITIQDENEDSQEPVKIPLYLIDYIHYI